jgi:hypothetical protein
MRWMGLLLLCVWLGTGCVAARSVRPAGEGKVVAGASFGGPMFTNLGGAIPTPLLSGYARYGLSNETDLDVGLQVPIVAAVGLDVGASRLLFPQQGARPAVMLGGRLNFWANPYGLVGKKDVNGRAYRLDPRLFEEAYGYASWQLGRFLTYVGLDVFAQLESLTIRPTLVAGTEWRASKLFGLQVELKQMAFTTNQEFAAVAFIGPANYGALALNLGFNFHLGAEDVP